MFLDARQFESHLELRRGLSKGDFRKKIVYEGNAVVLQMVNVRTYGGIIRLYVDSEGKSVSTGSTTVPMRIRNPYRLTEQGSYIIHFHLSLTELPTNVIARIIPTEALAKAGIIFTQSLIKGGDLEVSAIPLRRIEVVERLPMGLLMFSPVEILKDYEGVKKSVKEKKKEEEKEKEPNGANSPNRAA